MPLVGVYCEDPNLIAPTRRSWAECLACAATWKNPCSLNYPILKAIAKDAQAGHSFPSVTALTGCLRQAWLRQTTEYFEYPSGRLALLFGTFTHSLLEDSNGAQSLAEIPLKWTTGDGIEVTGTADLYVVPSRTLADFKTAKDIVLSRLPYGNHEEQVNVYAFMLERNEAGERYPVDRLRMVYISKAGPDTRGGAHNGVAQVEVARWAPERAEVFVARRAWLLEQAMRGATTPKMVARGDRWRCNYCPVRARCEELGE